MFNPQNFRLMRAVCGLDVHKDSVYLCILHDSGEIIENVYGVLTFQLEESNYSVIIIVSVVSCWNESHYR